MTAIIPSETIKQARVPDHMLGRITGTVRSISRRVGPARTLPILVRKGVRSRAAVPAQRRRARHTR
ncbi:hypothetical protein OHS70_20220 [Streptomyces sp. NBC_00390]|uniref:hypothetical protein n=1 Tax=Streptomyces sp. NBC_00390 TaxID=2975736 RepID=UPI002E201CD7